MAAGYPLRRLEDFAPGLVRERDFSISAEETAAFIAASGDRHPLHTREAFARERGFPGLLLHGMCIAARSSSFVTEEFVGRHGLLVSMASDFRRPSRPGEALRWRAEVLRVAAAARTVEVKWSVAGAGGTVTACGTACAWIGDAT